MAMDNNVRLAVERRVNWTVQGGMGGSGSGSVVVNGVHMVVTRGKEDEEKNKKKKMMKPRLSKREHGKGPGEEEEEERTMKTKFKEKLRRRRECDGDGGTVAVLVAVAAALVVPAGAMAEYFGDWLLSLSEMGNGDGGDDPDGDADGLVALDELQA